MDHQSSFRALVVAAILAIPAIMIGCSSDGSAPAMGGGPIATDVIGVQNVDHFALISGSGQTVPAGQQSALPLVVGAFDIQGRPVQNVPVKFRIRTGNASIVPDTAVTDAGGLARAFIVAAVTGTRDSADGGPVQGDVSIPSRNDLQPINFTATISVDVTPFPRPQFIESPGPNPGVDLDQRQRTGGTPLP